MSETGLNWETVRLSLWTWIVESLSGHNIFPERVVWRDQSAPQPKPPYVTLKIIAGPLKPEGIDDFRWDETNEVYTRSGLRQFTLSVQAFGWDSLQILSTLVSRIEFPEVLAFFARSKLALVNSPGIVDVSALIETSIEQRSSVDFIFNAAQNAETITGPIEVVDISGTIDGNAVPPAMEPEFTVDSAVAPPSP